MDTLDHPFCMVSFQSGKMHSKVIMRHRGDPLSPLECYAVYCITSLKRLRN